ncbi:MAG: hypothetical protein PUF10_06120 [Bacteroidales bacterium]|nr:hypothetical protein [Bacteroidales bacterium]
MFSIPSPKTRVSISGQLANAAAPIVCTLSGMITFFKEVQLANAPAPMLVRVYGSCNSFISDHLYISLEIKWILSPTIRVSTENLRIPPLRFVCNVVTALFVNASWKSPEDSPK